jgi:hypothetical protein
VIPLGFAQTPANCPNRNPQFSATGSPMLRLQMYQWLTGWCNGAGSLAVQYVSNPESTARNEFLAPAQAGVTSADMALVTLPVDPNAQQGSSRKFTYAPLANSGTGIAFEVDDESTGTQLNRMVLNPRLLAKLTTQSYALQYGCTIPPETSPPQAGEFCDPAVLNDPVTLFDDPEFRSLNKECQAYGTPFAQPTPYICGAHAAQPNNALGPLSAYDDFPVDNGNSNPNTGVFLPSVLSQPNDMTYNLTAMIGANSDAAGFLGGKTDPWGAHVNNNYVRVPYPEQQFNLLDNGASNPAACFTSNGVPECGTTTVWNGTMSKSWIPQVDLNTIAQDLLTAQPTSQSSKSQCPDALNSGCTNVNQLTSPTLPAVTIGDRALLSELDLGDIANYAFPAASIVNASGTSVAPSQASVEAAVKDMKTNPDGVTQYYDNSSTDKAAYPLSMTDYAMVPTCGLSKSEASDIAQFLTRAATTGQVQGAAPGQLGPGYYPLTAAQKAQTLKAASEVKSQDCKSTPLDTTIGGRPGVNDVTTPAHGGGPGATGTGAPTSAGAATPGKSAKSGSPSASATPGSAPNAKAQTAAFGQKSADSGLTGLLLLLAMILGGLAVIGGPAAWAVTVTGKWPVVASWVRPAWSWAPPAWARFQAIRIRRP